MAGEIQLADTTGRTLYAVVRSDTGTVYNTAGGTFEAYNAANWTDYDIAMTEQGVSGYYVGTFPFAGVNAGIYNVEIRLRAGGSPAVSDTPVGAGEIEWSVAGIVGSLCGGTIVADSVVNVLNNVGGSVGGSVLGSVGSVDVGGITAATFAAGALNAVWTTALTEAYRATGATGTAAQLMYEILAHLGEFANAGTTKTLKKLDGVSTAKTFSYDDANTPTSITEAT